MVVYLLRIQMLQNRFLIVNVLDFMEKFHLIRYYY